MTDKIERLFENVTVDDFLPSTTAVEVKTLPKPTLGPDVFAEFVDTSRQAALAEWERRSDGHADPIAMLQSARERRIFLAEDHETNQDFWDRLHREAVQMEASWLSMVMVSAAGALEDTQRQAFNYKDDAGIDRAVEQGLMREALVSWVHDRVRGKQIATYWMIDDDGTLMPPLESDPAHSPLLEAILTG